MGLFGNVDVAEVPDDPFYVADGTRLSLLTELKSVETADGKHGLAFKWVIQEEDDEYNGSQIQEWKTTYPDLEEDDLTPEIKKDLSRLKQRLLQIGVTEEDMDNWNDEIAQTYIGTEAYVTVKNTVDQDDPNKKFCNVRYVRLPE